MPASLQFKILNLKFKINSGFTLVELMVVITIIAILSVVGVTVYSGVTKSAKGAARRADIEAISKAYEANFDGNNYRALTTSDFAGGTIPAPYSGGSYFVAGPNYSASANKNFAVCASLVDDSQCFANSPTCFCKTSTQGDPIDTYSIGNPITNGSFETPGSGGIASGWSPSPAGSSAILSIVTSPVHSGSYAQKIVQVGGPYQGIKQVVTGLKPSTSYKETGWMYMESGHGTCTSVGVGMQGPGGETFTGCNRLDQWVQLTLTGNSDASGNYAITFQNWSDAYFYVDDVKLEEVK